MTSATQTGPGTVLVTGAGHRIGKAIALHLGKQGWRVAVHYHRSSGPAQDVADQIIAAGGRAETIRADLRDEKDRDSLMERTGQVLGPVTCLINNASIFEPDTITDMTPESWQAHQMINLYAPLRLAQDFAKALPEGEKGNIINIIDQRVWRLTPKFFSYTIAKSSLWTATRTMAQELAPRIRVNAIGPGPTAQNVRQSEADFERQYEGVLMKSPTNPDDIAAAISFIIATPSFTGQMLALDGGQHLSWETLDVVDVGEE